MLEISVIETKRLLLRQPQASDLAAWSAFMSDSQATRFIGGPQDEEGAWRNLCMFIGAWTVSGYSNFSIIKKTTGQWIGRAGPWQPPGWTGPEVGWALAPAAWGKGYATEAAAGCLDWVFKTLNWPEALHVIHPDNHASIAVAKRLNATFRSIDDKRNCHIYTVDRQTWEENPQ